MKRNMESRAFSWKKAIVEADRALKRRVELFKKKGDTENASREEDQLKRNLKKHGVR